MKVSAFPSVSGSTPFCRVRVRTLFGYRSLASDAHIFSVIRKFRTGREADRAPLDPGQRPLVTNIREYLVTTELWRPCFGQEQPDAVRRQSRTFC